MGLSRPVMGFLYLYLYSQSRAMVSLYIADLLLQWRHGVFCEMEFQFLKKICHIKFVLKRVRLVFSYLGTLS
jgi:hypothetical protein